MKPTPLEIRLAGEPVLRHTARKLAREEILSPTTQQLIEQMRETMYRAPGVGLAAPQIGLGLELAVIEDKPEYMKDIPPVFSPSENANQFPFMSSSIPCSHSKPLPTPTSSKAASVSPA
jgi:peptide deformylase